MRKNILNILKFLIPLAVIFYLLFQRYKLGMVRYYDMDEFIYLNLANKVFTGQRPYIDFMFLVTPLYLYILAPLNLFFKGTDYIFAARGLAFAISLYFYLAGGYLFYILRKNFLWLCAVIILIILPLPSDKILEIRPDILAVSFSLTGIIFLIKADFRKKLFLISSGIFFALSILTSQKMLPAIAICFVFYYAVLAIKKISLKEGVKNIFIFSSGLIFCTAIFIIWAYLNGDVDKVIYGILNLPIEQAVSQKQNQPPDGFYFQPNIIYYGEWGESVGWRINKIIWDYAPLAAVFSIIIRAILRKKTLLYDFLVAFVFLFYYYMYISGKFIFRYPQYLIPASIFTGFYTAEILGLMKYFSDKNIFSKFFFYIFIAGAGIYSIWFFDVTTKYKFSYTNQIVTDKIAHILNTIPKNEYILDLEGRTIFYPNPYYICCYAFGQFEPYLSRPLPLLEEALTKTRTKYIYQAEINRIGALSKKDQKFIADNYYPTINGEMWIAKNW